MNKGMKWGYSTVAALTLLFSTAAGPVTSAFAADNSTAGQTATTTNSTTSSSTTNPTATTPTTTTSSTDSTAKAGILPDNFFYFVKTMMQQINLAFTTNDAAKAKELANYAAQKIAEANALIKDGKTDLAVKTLQQAIDEQNQATNLQAKVTVGTPTVANSGTAKTSTGTNQPTATNMSDTTNTTSTNGQGSALPTATTTTTTQDQNSQDQATGDQQDSTQKSGTSSDQGSTSTSGQATANSTATTPSGSALDTSKLVQANPRLANNIYALLNALQHIKNPKAQAALTKNIEKSFAKLGGKIDKLQKLEQEDQNNQNQNDQTVASTDNTQTTQGTENEDSKQSSDQGTASQGTSTTTATTASTSTGATADTKTTETKPAPVKHHAKPEVKPEHHAKKVHEVKADTKKVVKAAKKEVAKKVEVVDNLTNWHEKGHSNEHGNNDHGNNGHGDNGNNGHHHG